ncbi:hypothetical protein GCM10011583_10840 [Streptomyces camponoticapitis]|uniref:Secreted protein n=1 Tax=Streptomyces camponoticapitis TaxID=1616125 RepID=A0ABQ2E309_9ACTN|nr:hypothetical protein [Streptomyces camponoticapitis]GGJ81227.1 hypothetical protein GCM10011583_10840 [Streptomyces camponoticapitis]
MRKRLSSLVVAGAAAAAIIPAAASPAAAAVNAVGASCSVTGASGSGSWVFASRTQLNSVSLRITDTSADGHHVAIQLQTVQGSGATHLWPLHHEYGGNGASHTWNTTATDSLGIKYAYIEAFVMEGGSVIRSCGDSSITNPYY